MSEERNLQDIIQAAVEAEIKGVNIDWKGLCFQTYNVAMEEIKRLTDLADAKEKELEQAGVRPDEPITIGKVVDGAPL